ncbi:MAG: hypothetical protein GYB31_08980 [Bacteroidetes bacterium]|nr:hypothetical protein [Bacteroidota bacterium]
MAVLLIGLIAWSGYEITTWQNVLGNGRMLLWASVLGAAAGLLVGNILARGYDDQVDQIRLRALGLFGGIILFIAGASFLNRTFADEERPVTVTFVGQKMYGASRFGMTGDSIKADGYYLYFKVPERDDTSRIRLEYAYPTPAAGEQMELPIREGLFGVELVDLK